MSRYFKRQGKNSEPTEHLGLDTSARTQIHAMLTHSNAAIRTSAVAFQAANDQYARARDPVQFNNTHISRANIQNTILESCGLGMHPSSPRERQSLTVTQKLTNCFSAMPAYAYTLCCYPRVFCNTVEMSQMRKARNRAIDRAVQNYLQAEQALINTIENQDPALFATLTTQSVLFEMAVAHKKNCCSF
jgi:hypothetical protein